MNYKLMEITVDFQKQLYYKPVTFVKGDRGSCKVKFNITQNITDMEVYVSFKFSDGKGALHKAINVDANNAELVLPSGVLSVAGRVDCQVAIYENAMADRLTNHVNFYYNVSSDLSEEAVEASDQLPVLTQLIEDVETLESNVTAAEALRVTAENARESNESTRQTNESGRVSAESSRASAESTRSTNESGRVSAESGRVTTEGNRVTAESGRASAESSRASAESSRASAESTRGTNETGRINAENGRVSAESSRASAEITRGTNEGTRQSNEAGRVNAESSRVTAENARVAAETAREAKLGHITVNEDVNLDTMKGDVDQLKGEQADGKITLSEQTSIFSAGTGKDPDDVTQDYNTIIQDAIAEFLFKGLSINQIAKNGNFVSGTNDWSDQIGCNDSVVDQIYIMTGNGNFPNIESKQVLNHQCNANDKWFFFYSGKPDNSISTGLAMNIRGNTVTGTVQFITKLDYIANQYNDVYDIITIPSNAEGFVQIRIGHNYVDNATANGKVMEVDGTAGVFAINMTQCGYYSYLDNKGYTDEEKKAIMYNLVKVAKWWYGRKDVVNPRIRSVGKNIFNANYNLSAWETSSVFDEGEQKITVSGNWYVCYKDIEVEPNTTYYFSGSKEQISGSGAMAHVWENNSHVTPLRAGWGAFTTGSDTRIIGLAFYCGAGSAAVAEFTNVQIEKGSSATDYEPYKENTVQLKNTVLRSLPKGTRDDVDMANGLLGKRIEKRVLESADIIGFNTGWTYVDAVQIQLPSNCVDLTSTGDINGSVLLSDYPEVANIDDSDSIGGHVERTIADVDYIYIVTAKGIYADLAAAQAALAGTEIIYELAEPIITDITDQVEGILEVFQNGTIYLESGVEESISVTGTSHVLTEEFNEVEEVWYLDGDDLVLLDEDTWTFTLATMTLSGLTDGMEYLVKGVPEGYMVPGTEIDYSFTTKDVIKSNSGGVLQNTEKISKLDDALAMLIAGM